jgi:hypothetical protein
VVFLSPQKRRDGPFEPTEEQCDSTLCIGPGNEAKKVVLLDTHPRRWGLFGPTYGMGVGLFGLTEDDENSVAALSARAQGTGYASKRGGRFEPH